MHAHNTGATFDAALIVDGVPAYRRLFAFAPDGGSSVVYDLELGNKGRLSDATDSLQDFVALHKFLIPAAGDQHLARLSTPASTAQQVIPILHGLTQFGTVTFEIGDNEGIVVIDADEAFGRGDILTIGLPGATDATAAGVIVGFAAQRLLS